LHEPGCLRTAGTQAAPAHTCAHGFVHKAYLSDLVEVKLDRLRASRYGEAG